jgi:cellulose synthase/poly-beta-1,6-N-acetylglucosamine synthase-like glycosyltransferase
VVSNVNGGQVRWAGVSYINLNALLFLTALSYPAFLVAGILFIMVLVSMCLSTAPDSSADTQTSPVDVGTAAWDPMCEKVFAPVESLTDWSKKVYRVWVFFCSTIPSLMVFATPAVITALARPYPQEVFSVLTLITSVFLFSNGMYMFVFAGSSILRMRHSMRCFVNLPEDTSQVATPEFPLSREVSPESRASGITSEASHDSARVMHWVILPQYKESVEVVSMALRSICHGPLGRRCISVVLAMEEREPEAKSKVEELQRVFGGRFKEILATYHPPDLPNHPPGKASNLCWAFGGLMQHLWRQGANMDNIVLTVADADSEFSPGYFEVLGAMFAAAGKVKRYETMWQSPIMHMKNYHRQPGPVCVGMMFTSMAELSTLSDPNAIRFPYSSYSLSLNLARRVGGWDPDWIAEDYHMGIKCFLLTMGQVNVEPLMLPTVNYTPEEEGSWLGTVRARWIQAKRHSLGFSDVSYYFMMLPLIFAYAGSKVSQEHNITALSQFWRMTAQGICLLIKLINIHVVIGVLTTYGVLQMVLRAFMNLAFDDTRAITFLFERTGYCPTVLMVSGSICSLFMASNFMSLYKLLVNRIEGEEMSSVLKHFVLSFLKIVVCAPLYMLGIGFCSWLAAWNVLTVRSFEYEVAPKPIPVKAETQSPLPGMKDDGVKKGGEEN